jgi:ABC-2 type transport system permease protein
VTRFLTDVATISRRELLRYRQERVFLLGQILFPIVAVLVIGLGLNRPVGEVGSSVDYASFLAAGVLMLVLLSSALGGGYTLIQDAQRGFLRPVLVAPVSRTSIVLGKIVARLLLSTVLVLVLIGVLALFTGVGLPHPGIAAGTLIATTFGFVALGILIASGLRSLESFRTVAVFLTFPLYLLSGMFFPVSTMPGPMRVLALANPLTYAVDLFRYSTTSLAELSLALDATVVGAIAIVPTLLAIRAFETKLTE